MKSDFISKWTETYMRSVEGEWSALRVGDAQIPLKDVYVMLQALPVPTPKVQEKRTELGDVPERLEHAGLEREPRDPMPTPVALSQALGDTRDLVLLGEPGSGKSTVLQFIGLCFVHGDWSKSRLLLHEERVPIKINLREHAKLLANPEPGLEKALNISVSKILRLSEEQSQELIQSWQDKDRLLVLLDGLDEVPDALRPAVDDEINKFTACEQGRKCRLVVSSRPAGYVSLGGSFQEFTLKPFEKADESKPFLQGWLSAFRLDWPKEKAESEAGWLYDRMAAQPALERILDNPLILRLSAQVYASKGREGVARNRADLYRLYTNELWDRAVHNRGVDANQKEDVWRAIELLAWQLQLNQKPTVPEAVLTIIHAKMGLVAWSEDALVFSHTTIQEYFVGRRLARAWLFNHAGAWAFLRPRLHIPSWREPILLMAGALDGKAATRLVHQVLRAGSPYDHWLFRDQALAASLIVENEGVEHRELQMLLRDVRWPISWWGKISFGRRWEGLLPILFRILVELKVVEAVPDLIWALNDQKPEVRSAAAAALGELKAMEAVPNLLRALKDQDKHVRSAVARALGAIKAMKAVPDLLVALKEDPKREVRYSAAEALGELNAVEAAPDLRRALKNQEWYVRAEAARALGMMKVMEAVPDLCQTLKDQKWEVRSETARALGAMKAMEAIPDLLQLLNDQDKWVRSEAARVLGMMNAVEAMPNLLQLLENDWDSQVRSEAARALGELKAVEVVPDFLRLLKDDQDSQVRSEVARILGELKAVEAVPDLLRLLKDDPDPQVRSAAAWAFGELKAMEAVPELLLARKDRDRDVRSEAVEALGRINVVKAMPDLLQVLNGDPEGGVRSAAARALGAMKTIEAVPDLLRALWDQEERVRFEAIGALGAMKAMEAVPDLLQLLGDQYKWVRSDAAHALTTIFSMMPTQHDVLSPIHQIKILRSLAAHKDLDADQQRTIANRLSALQAAKPDHQDPFQKYKASQAQKAVQFVLVFLTLVFLAALVVVLDTFFGTVQDVLKHNFGPLIEPWISSHPFLAFLLLLVFGVVIVIVAIYRDRFAELLPGKPSKEA